VYVKRYVAARYCTHCGSGNAINITYYVCVCVCVCVCVRLSVSVTLIIQHAMRMHRIVICDLSGSTIFSNSMS
jgi:hypothetical protein